MLLADGYVPRVVGYGKYKGEPSWHPFNGSLLRSATVSGRVVDESQKPLADAEIKLIDFENLGENYQTAEDFRTTTDAEGRFHFDNVPTASANVMLHKKGYVLPGLGPTIKTPAADVVLTMKQSAQLHVTVDFTGSKRSESYIVELEPEGGNVVGSWGGSSQIDDKNQVSFHDAPPGKYFLQGHPNPHQDKELSKRIPVELKGGEPKRSSFPPRQFKARRPFESQSGRNDGERIPERCVRLCQLIAPRADNEHAGQHGGL